MGANVVSGGQARDFSHGPGHQTTDAYAVLHLLPTAPPELIKAAYRCLAMIHHPDRGGDTEAMQRINSAYAGLSAKLARA
jgi:curved DNA-binding protein CbpA